MPDVYVAAERHEHGPTETVFDRIDKPWLDIYRPPGSVYLCDCGRYVHLSVMAGAWVPVRWWNFKARRRIAEYRNCQPIETGDTE